MTYNLLFHSTFLRWGYRNCFPAVEKREDWSVPRFPPLWLCSGRNIFMAYHQSSGSIHCEWTVQAFCFVGQRGGSPPRAIEVSPMKLSVQPCPLRRRRHPRPPTSVASKFNHCAYCVANIGQPLPLCPFFLPPPPFSYPPFQSCSSKVSHNLQPLSAGLPYH